ncbi:MAG: hypothetical protein LBL83_11125 [Clostridiales bacterium]|jgi:hypothetical protein|nr:hypothetical protein [Clostridiales bacterium]
MGWSSYSLQVYYNDKNKDNSGNYYTSAQGVMEQSDAMREKLGEYGYEYINIDAGWNGEGDEWGRPQPSAEKYPGGLDGFLDVVRHVHANGQKIGIYCIPGIGVDTNDSEQMGAPIYGMQEKYGRAISIGEILAYPYQKMDAWDAYTLKIDFSKAGAQEYIDSLVDMFGDWGVDFIKLDSVTSGSDRTDRDPSDDVIAYSKACARNSIWLTISWAVDHGNVGVWKKWANAWRVEHDIEAYDYRKGMVEWGTILRLLPAAELWWRDAGPSTGWNCNPIVFLMNAFTYYGDFQKYMVVNGGRIEPSFTTDEFKEGLKYIRSLYEQELIAPETFTQDGSQLTTMGLAQPQILGAAPVLNSYLDEMRTRFVTGDADIDAEWDIYLRQLDQMGLQEYLAVLQKTYDAKMAALG